MERIRFLDVIAGGLLAAPPRRGPPGSVAWTATFSDAASGGGIADAVA